jgi:hypothetical protein
VEGAVCELRPNGVLGSSPQKKWPPGRSKSGHPADAPTPGPTVQWRRGGRYSFPYYLRYRARPLSLAAPFLFPIASGAALALAYSDASGSSPSELRLYGVLRSSRAALLSVYLSLEPTDRPQAALKNTMADAPTTTTTRIRIRMAGSSTTSSALPVLVECISRIPTVAR